MDAVQAARKWARAWEAAWRAHDASAVARLYAPEASFRSTPFRPPVRGPEGVRDYAVWAFESEESAVCWFGEPVTDAGDRAVVEYWAVSTDKKGRW
jgi:ketosteroid isomerase-like protein